MLSVKFDSCGVAEQHPTAEDEPAMIRRLPPWWKVRRGFAWYLARMAFERTKRPVWSWYAQDRVCATLAGARMESLIQALERKNELPSIFRGNVIFALGELGDTRAVEPLIDELVDEDWDIRRSAAGALGKLGDTSALEPLAGALRDEDWSVRREAAEALSKLDDMRAVEPLIETLGDEVEIVRRGAAWALGLLGDARAIGPLTKALTDRDMRVRDAADEALKMICPAA